MTSRFWQWLAQHKQGSAVAGTAVAIAVGVGIYVGSRHPIPTPRPQTTQTLLWLYAPRDVGRLPAASGWCTLVRPAEHCWLMQETSGTAQDTGSTGGWHLTASGATRRGVVTGWPVAAGTTWDATSELAQGVDQREPGGFSRGLTTDDATDLVSYTVLFSAPRAGPAYGYNYLWLTDSATRGHEIYTQYSAPNYLLTAYARGSGGNKYVTATVPTIADGAPHCLTVVFSSREQNASRMYMDGEDYTPEDSDLSTVTTVGATGLATQYAYRKANSFYALAGLGGRIRRDLASLSLDDHRTLCGSAWQAPDGGDTLVSAGDNHYEQADGAARCYASGAHTATCAPSRAPWYAWDSVPGAYRWPVEPGRTNRLLWSTGATCTRWTCSTATMAYTPAPDGTHWATTITMGGGYAQTTATAYSASAPLYHRVWLKASAGTIDASHVGGAGHWTIDGTALGGEWTELYTGHPAVTEVQAWSATGAGAVTYRVSGADVSIWAPTLTTVAGLSVIQTGAAAETTVAPTWYVDDIANSYRPSSATVTSAVREIAGTCYAESGSLLMLSGASTCTGYWGELKIIGRPPADTGIFDVATGRTELYVLAGQSNAEGRMEIATLDATLLSVPAGVEYYHNDGNISAQVPYLTRWNDFSVAVKFGGAYYYGAAPMLANRLIAARPKKRIILAHMGLGGTSLYAAWQPYDWSAARGAVTGEAAGVYQWSTVVSRIHSALGKRKARFVALYWMQGEQDCLYQTAADDYAAGLALFQTALTARYGWPERRIIARVRCEAGNPGLEEVRAAQEATPYWFNVDDLPLKDTVHFNEPGYYTLGIRFAAAYLPSP